MHPSKFSFCFILSIITSCSTSRLFDSKKNYSKFSKPSGYDSKFEKFTTSRTTANITDYSKAYYDLLATVGLKPSECHEVYVPLISYMEDMYIDNARFSLGNTDGEYCNSHSLFKKYFKGTIRELHFTYTLNTSNPFSNGIRTTNFTVLGTPENSEKQNETLNRFNKWLWFLDTVSKPYSTFRDASLKFWAQLATDFKEEGCDAVCFAILVTLAFDESKPKADRKPLMSGLIKRDPKLLEDLHTMFKNCVNIFYEKLKNQTHLTTAHPAEETDLDPAKIAFQYRSTIEYPISEFFRDMRDEPVPVRQTGDKSGGDYVNLTGWEGTDYSDEISEWNQNLRSMRCYHNINTVTKYYDKRYILEVPDDLIDTDPIYCEYQSEFNDNQTVAIDRVFCKYLEGYSSASLYSSAPQPSSNTTGEFQVPVISWTITRLFWFLDVVSQNPQITNPGLELWKELIEDFEKNMNCNVFCLTDLIWSSKKEHFERFWNWKGPVLGKFTDIDNVDEFEFDMEFAEEPNRMEQLQRTMKECILESYAKSNLNFSKSFNFTDRFKYSKYAKFPRNFKKS